MYFEIFGSWEGFCATSISAEVRFLLRMSSAVNKHLIACIKTPVRSLTALPSTKEHVFVSNGAVSDADMIRQFFQRLESS